MQCFAFVICHRLEEFVDRAIASIATQTRKPDAIFVVCTDCRSESTKAVYHWLSSPHQVRYVSSEKPLTCTESKNLCGEVVAQAATSSGLYTEDVAFFTLDADDWVEPRFIERCLGYMEQSGAGAVGCDYELLSPDGYRSAARANTVELHQLDQANPLPSCSLIRLSSFLAVGGYTQESNYEDWCFWIKLHILNHRIFRYPQNLFTYRIHSRNLSQKYDAPLEFSNVRNFLAKLKNEQLQRTAIQGAN